MEVGYPDCPLTISFIGDYGQDTKKSFTQTSIPKPYNIFSAFQDKNDNQTENTTSSDALVIFEIVSIPNFIL